MMAFLNEYISDDDFKKYDFEVLNKRPKERSGTTPASQWTVDRNADIWLRKFYTESDHTEPDGGFTGVAVWDYYWKGSLMLVKVKTIEGGGGRNQHCWARKRVLSIDIPKSMESHRAEILEDLKAAFIAYRDGGVLARATSYSFELEY